MGGMALDYYCADLRERKRVICVFATDTKKILGQIAKFMYLRLCVFMFCVFVFLGTLQYRHHHDGRMRIRQHER